MESVWVKNTNRPQFNALQGDIKTDVLIIGGGMAGVLCACRLKNKGVDCVLVEANRICGGVTENTTAKITLQHGLIYDKIMRKYGLEAARLYFESQRAAVEEYRRMCMDFACDFEESDSFVYSRNSREKIEKEAAAIEKIGARASFLDKLSIPIKVAGALKISGQAQFNPLKFAFHIAKDLPVYENTRVLELTKDGAVTERGIIAAQKIIVATHFPFINKHGGYFFKMYQHRSYVIALKNIQIPDGMYVDEAEGGMSFRTYGDLTFIGGGGHRTGKHGGNWHELREFADKYYPGVEESGFWATQDCMTLDSIPYIGQYSKRTPDLYVATGFNKWGMTNSMVASEILADMVLGKENEYAPVYSPSRNIWHGQLAINTSHALAGIITPTAPRCPHMGCALKYNESEHSWDCPCHGSRFGEDGKLLDNPATGNKKRIFQRNRGKIWLADL